MLKMMQQIFCDFFNKFLMIYVRKRFFLVKNLKIFDEFFLQKKLIFFKKCTIFFRNFFFAYAERRGSFLMKKIIKIFYRFYKKCKKSTLSGFLGLRHFRTRFLLRKIFSTGEMLKSIVFYYLIIIFFWVFQEISRQKNFCFHSPFYCCLGVLRAPTF